MTGSISLTYAVCCAGETNHGKLLQSRAKSSISGLAEHELHQRLGGPYSQYVPAQEQQSLRSAALHRRRCSVSTMV